MTPSVADLTGLEELARAATPGLWTPYVKTVQPEMGGNHEYHASVIDADHKRVCILGGGRINSDPRNAVNAAYIAACSPEVILALVRVARAAQELDFQGVHTMDEPGGYDELQTALQALK